MLFNVLWVTVFVAMLPTLMVLLQAQTRLNGFPEDNAPVLRLMAVLTVQMAHITIPLRC